MASLQTNERDVIAGDTEKPTTSIRNEHSGDVEAAPAAAPTYDEIDPEIEKRVRRKLDYHIVPLVAALYLLAFLDRSNIGCVFSRT